MPLLVTGFGLLVGVVAQTPPPCDRHAAQGWRGMNQKPFMIAAGTAVVLLAAGIWLSMHRSNLQGNVVGYEVFSDLEPALGEVEEIRFSKGDGSRTTLRKSADGWIVVERQYPADSGRVRELALALANLKVVERKTSDPANYAKLGVEAPDTPTAGSTLVEVVAGKKTWALIVGKGADGRGVYVRKPAEVASALATPLISADPDQKRWIDRLLTDIPGDERARHRRQAGERTGLSTDAREIAATAELTLEPSPEGPHAGELDVAQWPGRCAQRFPLRRRARRSRQPRPRRRTSRPTAPSMARSSSSPGIARARRPTSR